VILIFWSYKYFLQTKCLENVVESIANMDMLWHKLHAKGQCGKVGSLINIRNDCLKKLFSNCELKYILGSSQIVLYQESIWSRFQTIKCWYDCTSESPSFVFHFLDILSYCAFMLWEWSSDLSPIFILLIWLCFEYEINYIFKL